MSSNNVLFNECRKRLKSFSDYAHERSNSEDGFMGYTHALITLAFVLIVIAFFENQLFGVIGTDNFWVIIMFVVTCIGATMIPDLDNTHSRAKSDLGIFGEIISVVFRVSSTFIQTTLKTSKDDPDPNPHRGFWHTIPAAFIIGFLIFLGSGMKNTINLPMIGEIKWGALFALLISAVLIYLTLSTLCKEYMDKLKKSASTGEFIAFGLSIVITILLFVNIPTEIDYRWLAISVILGMIMHDVSDAFTTSGNFIFFPITYFTKGRFWWATRFSHIKAGSDTEKNVIVPSLVIIIILVIIYLIFGIF